MKHESIFSLQRLGKNICFCLENDEGIYWGNIVDVDNQLERSKREDFLIRELIENSTVDLSKLKNDPPYPLVWDKDLNFIGHKVIEEMRYSEHGGNIVREVQ